MKTMIIALMLTAAGAALTPGAASAAPRHRHRARPAPAATYSAPPLTIQPRSYLDPGNVVPEGSLENYVYYPATTPDLYETGGLAWRYGAGTLPGPFTLPGRPESLGDF